MKLITPIVRRQIERSQSETINCQDIQVLQDFYLFFYFHRHSIFSPNLFASSHQCWSLSYAIVVNVLRLLSMILDSNMLGEKI